jgi:predicted HAD superfamily phosphohydrolase
VYRTASTPTRVVFAIVDIITLPISLLALLIYLLISDASGEMEARSYLSNADNDSLTDYYILMDKIYSLPEEKFASLKLALDSIPEKERVSSLKKLAALSESDLVSLIDAYNSLSETEIISSVERITALSGEDRVSLLRDFNSLSETELISSIEELKSISNTRHFAAADYSGEEAYTGAGFQY